MGFTLLKRVLLFPSGKATVLRCVWRHEQKQGPEAFVEEASSAKCIVHICLAN